MKRPCGLALVLLLAVVGCSEFPDPYRPAVPAGRIQGRVSTGGLLMPAVISAVRVLDDGFSASTIETNPDEAGLYSLDVPAGKYVISLEVGSRRYIYQYAGSELSYGNVAPDTVWVDAQNSPLVVDFVLGGVAFEMEPSDLLNGAEGSIALHRRGDEGSTSWRTYVNTGSGVIANGALIVYVAGVLPGEYQIEVVLGDRWGPGNVDQGEHFWLPGVRDRLESPWYRVDADAVLSLGQADIAATSAARLQGQVVGAWQTMGLTSLPELSVVDTDSVTIMRSRRVHSDGSFDVAVHFPGPVKLMVTQDGVARWIGGPRFSEATVYPLRAGQTIAGVELVQSGVRFRVGMSGTSYSEGVLRIYDPTDLTLLASREVGFRDQSQFAVANLWPGRFLFEMMPTSYRRGRVFWRPQWFDRAVEAEAAQPVSISGAGQIVALDLTLETGGVISGRVAPLAGAPELYHIIVTTADDPLAWGDQYAWGSQFSFAVMGLPDGGFRVGAVPAAQYWNGSGLPPVGTIWYPGTADWNAAAVVNIIDAGTVEGLIIEVP